MSFFPWNEQYSVNVAEIDNQHKKLVDLLNGLYEAMKSGKGKEIIGNVLNSLITYTRTHFTYEETLLRKYQYPLLEVHKNEHDKLTNKVLVFQKEFEEGRSVQIIEISNFLKDWLITHIQGTDKQYSTFLNGKGFK